MDYNDLADEDDEDQEPYDYRRDPDLLNKEDELRGTTYGEPPCLKVL